MDTSANTLPRTLSSHTSSTNPQLDEDELILAFVTASKSGDMPTFIEKLTEAVKLSPAMFELSNPACFANLLFGKTGADLNPQIRTVWENVLATVKNNGDVKQIQFSLNSDSYRSRRLRPLVSERPLSETKNPLIGSQHHQEIGPGPGRTGSVPTYSTSHSQSVNTSATAGEYAGSRIARFDLLSAEARKAFLNGDAKTYEKILAQLKAITPSVGPDANEYSIQ